MADRPPEELSEVEIEIRKDDFTHWMQLPVTREFRRRVLELFDHQGAILSKPKGESADDLRGRAEVLVYILEPFKLFDDD